MSTKLLLSFLAIFIMIGCSAKKTIETPEPDIDTQAIHKETMLWVYKPTVNIRDKASGSGEKLAHLVDGDSVIVLENKNGWYQIKTIDGTAGWIRSDLLGPKELSAFRHAVIFVEDLKTNDQIEVFFDKNLYHKRIYISYPAALYNSKTDVVETTRKLVKKYQEEVYRGHVTARVLKPGSEEEYISLEIDGSVNADPILPIIPFGRIEKADRNTPSQIKLSYSAPEDISDEKLIATARQLTTKFPISYKRVEITFKNAPFSKEQSCRLWFMEDENGEDYKVGECN